MLCCGPGSRFGEATAGQFELDQFLLLAGVLKSAGELGDPVLRNLILVFGLDLHGGPPRRSTMPVQTGSSGFRPSLAVAHSVFAWRTS
jgi:hypothetical protein